MSKALTIIPQVALGLAFLLILILPAAEEIWHFAPEIELSENRTRNDYPLLEWTAGSLSTYPTRFEGAFNDNFGFRALLVQWQALAKLCWLKMSPSPKVIRGRENWFYLVNSINEHRGIHRLPKATVATWVREFRAKQAFLEARGIRYLIVIAPNKETIYPEFLPQDIRQFRKKLWVDDILEALPINSGVDILDLRAPLLEAKKFGRLYQRTDSHWTGLGLEVATNAIIARLVSKCPGLKPGKIDQSPPVAWGRSGDLARLMGLQNHLREEALMIMPPDKFVRAADLRYHNPVGGLHIPFSVVESITLESHCSLILAGDSFSEVLGRFLSAHFRRTLRLRPEVPYAAEFEESLPPLIEAEKPDVYIELVVDRNLFLPPAVVFASKEKVGN